MEGMVTTKTAGKLIGRSPKRLRELIRDLNSEAAANPEAPEVIYLHGRVDMYTLRLALKSRARREGGRS